MTLNKVWGRSGWVSKPSSAGLDLHGVCARPRMNLATVFLTLAGVACMASSGLSQGAVPLPPNTTTSHSTCAIDPQGLMCNVSSHDLEAVVLPSQANGLMTTSVMQPLTNAQMEQLSNVLLGFLYFVLPIGFGLGLLLHDRYQAYQAATLEAQIKLLEKLWEQSPQA